MTEENQIEEMAEMLEIIEKARDEYANDITDHSENEYIREGLLNAGYRKQSEGEWEQQPRPYEDEIMCSACGANFNILDNCTEKFDYCPNCGAKMKGGAE